MKARPAAASVRSTSTVRSLEVGDALLALDVPLGRAPTQQHLRPSASTQAFISFVRESSGSMA